MENTFRLCHGTSEVRLRRILREGIKPRMDSERGNFDGEIASLAGHTYLTGYYALFYAQNASPSLYTQRGRLSSRNPKRVIIEVDPLQLDSDLLRPDEDALRQYMEIVRMLNDDAAFRQVYERKPTDEDRAFMKEIISIIPGGETFITVDTEAMREYWSHSYRLIGSIAYKGVVPPEAIVCYATVDPLYAKRIIQWGVNAQMNVMIHRLCGARQCSALTDLIFDGAPLFAYELSPDLSRADVQKLRETIWTTESDRLATEAERQKGVRVYTLGHAQGASDVNPAE